MATVTTWQSAGGTVAEGTEEAGRQAGQHGVVVHLLREAHRPGISGAQHREIRSVDGYLLVYACKRKTKTYQDIFVVVMIKVVCLSIYLSNT